MPQNKSNKYISFLPLTFTEIISCFNKLSLLVMTAVTWCVFNLGLVLVMSVVYSVAYNVFVYRLQKFLFLSRFLRFLTFKKILFWTFLIYGRASLQGFRLFVAYGIQYISW